MNVMKLLDVCSRVAIPVPWAEGDKIPWDDPAFSERMLKEHLSQDHDLASRRSETIDGHVEWIHENILSGQAAKILDLGCGPGLYASRLARLGHQCVGIDFSPASIAYAVKTAGSNRLACTYRQEDIRTERYGSGFGLVMLVFGEFNVFRPADARAIVEKAHDALADNGVMLFEPHTFAAVEGIGKQARSWYSADSGLFSDRPHICLTENFWDAGANAATQRYFIIDADTNSVTRYASTTQAYTNSQYKVLLNECGFDNIEFYSSLNGSKSKWQDSLITIVAR